MSKFEIRYPWAGKQCGNCKHIDLTYSYMSCPPKYNCKCFNKPVYANRTTCLEDDNKYVIQKENCDQKNLSCHLEGMAYEHGKIQLDHEQRIKDLERKLIDLASIVKQLDERSAGAEKAISKDNGRNYREISGRIDALEKDYKMHLVFDHNRVLYSKDMELISRYEPENKEYKTEAGVNIVKPVSIEKMEKVIRNSRPEAEDVSDYYSLDFKCGKCGKEYPLIKETACTNIRYCPNCGAKIKER